MVDTFIMRPLCTAPAFGDAEDNFTGAVAVEAGRMSVVELRNANVTGGINSLTDSFVELRAGSVDATPTRPILFQCNGHTMRIRSEVAFDDDGTGGNNNGQFEPGWECNVTIEE